MPLFTTNPTLEQAWRERVTAIREIVAEAPSRLNRLGATHEQLGILASKVEMVARAFFTLEDHWRHGWLPIAFGWSDIVDLLDAIDIMGMPGLGVFPTLKEVLPRNEVVFYKTCVGDLARLIEHANGRHLDWKNGEDEEKFAGIEVSQDELQDLVMAETVPEGLLRATPDLLQSVWA